MPGRPRSALSISAGEVRVVLGVFATLLWAMTVLVWVQAPVPCGDFLCPYTMGALVRDASRLYNVDAFHATQVALVPGTDALFYPPVYPPQLAVLMAPFSTLPFGVAVTIWSGITVVLYALMLRAAYRAIGSHLDRSIVALAAVAFPPFANVVGYGQNTVLILGACFLAWRALDRHNTFLAGAALGLLALKPQFGLPFAVITLAGREWRMLSGAICSALAQAAIVLVVMGPAAFSGYRAMIPDIIRNTGALEADSSHSHSLRALTRLLPDTLGQPLWVMLVAAVLWVVVSVWRSGAPVHVRLGIAMLAAVLVNPHLIAYDVVLLALPLLWFADWLAGRNALRSYPLALALLFVTLAFSWATLTVIQPSVLVMCWIGYVIWCEARLVPRRSPVAVAAR